MSNKASKYETNKVYKTVDMPLVEGIKFGIVDRAPELIETDKIVIKLSVNEDKVRKLLKIDHTWECDECTINTCSNNNISIMFNKDIKNSIKLQ